MRRKALVVLIHDLIVAGLSLPFAFFFRLGEDLTNFIDVLLYGSPAFALLAGVIFRASGMYRGVWRYASTSDLVAVVKSATLAVLVFMPLMFLVGRLSDIPRAVPVIQWLVLVVLLGGPRLAYRLLSERRWVSPVNDRTDEIPEESRKSVALVTIAVNDRIARGAATSAGILAVMAFYIWFFPSTDKLAVVGMLIITLLIVADTFMVWFRYRFGTYGDTALELIEIIEFLERHREKGDIDGTRISRFEPDAVITEEESTGSDKIRTASRA